MRKEKQPSFLARKELLTNKENQEYQSNKQSIQRRRFLSENKNLVKQNKYETRQDNYNKSKTGRFSNVLSKGLRTVSQRGGVTRALYRNQLPPTSYGKVRRGINGNTRGRPFGTKKHFDDNGSQISVYDWRRLQAQKRRIAIQQATINPAQQQVLNNIARRQAYERSNPEGRIIPSTNGEIYQLDSIFKEIEDASNIFP